MAFDRLVSLVSGLSVEAVGPPPLSGANFFVQRGTQVLLRIGAPAGDLPVAVAAQIHWGWAADPLVRPEPLSLVLGPDHRHRPLADLLIEEATSPRCGATALLASYVEALIVHLLRAEIEAGRAEAGVLAGLADPRLARALVAIHDTPDRDWRVEVLADLAGMSRSAFMAHFRAVMGETPIRYLRRWRLNHAREDLAQGARVGVVARRYGYASPEAFARAFQEAVGVPPSAVKTA